MEYEAKKVAETIEQYNKVFKKLQPSALFPFYHYPLILVTPETSIAINNKLKLWLVFTKIIGDLKRQNYDRSETSSLKVKLLSENLSIGSGVATRYTKDNKVLNSFGFTYTLRKVGDRWKIIVGTIHDAEPIF
ncbi:hypothetical protein LC593_03130 [Nostoc sp. CHAB 5844]|nr:hypothetical protein [Nostoc sp. CHAB 5844]